jgi:hypothetical protein
MVKLSIFYNGGNTWNVYTNERDSLITLRKINATYDKSNNTFSTREASPTWNEKKFVNIFLGRDKGKVNFLLVQWSSFKYSFVYGEKIKSFELKNKDSIQSVVSKFGNSYVPYPIMIGKEYTYLVDNNRKIVKIHNDDYEKRRDLDDLYEHLWKYSWLQTKNKSGLSKKELAKLETDMEKAIEWKRQFTNL